MSRFIITFLLALSILLALSFKAHATVNIDYFYGKSSTKIIDDMPRVLQYYYD